MTAEEPPERRAVSFARDELEAALAAAKVGIWSWSASSGELRWSPELLALYGVHPEAFEGTFEFFAGCIHPEDRASVLAEIGRAMEERRAHFFVRHRFLRPGGEVGWTECHGRCLLDDHGAPVGMTGVSVDTTARQLAEDRLRESEASLRVFSEVASDYVYRASLGAPAFAPQIIAGSFERITGYTPAEVAERGGWPVLVHADDRPRWFEVVESLRLGKPAVVEYRIVDRSGSQRWLRDRLRPLSSAPGGVVTEVVGGVQDISEQKSLESQLLHAQKMDALARLSGGVAHDFNNLLTVIFSAVELIRGGRGETETHLAEIEQALERAAELTQSLLALGRRQVGRPERMHVHALLDGARGLLTRAAGEQVRLEFRLEADGGYIHADPGSLQLVLLNLVVNARDAMPGGGAIRIRTAVHALTEADPQRPPELPPGDYVRVTVSDDGHGIEAEALPHIFEPFFTTKEEGRGTGLGLATAHGIVGQLGGTIEVETQVGRGTTFTLYLPAVEAVESRPSVPGPRPSIGGTESVLLVEDEPLVRRISARVLRELGYSVVEAESTEQALELGAERLRQFELLVSDVRLPGRSGVELAVELLALQPAARVVLMSGYTGDQPQWERLSPGCYVFLAKPFTPAGLAHRVRETLDARVRL